MKFGVLTCMVTTAFNLMSSCVLVSTRSLLVTVKWDKYIPVPDSYPPHYFPVGFCTAVPTLRG